MTRRFAVLLIFVSMLVIALAYLTAFSGHGAPPWAAPVTAIATAAGMVAFLLLGAARPRRSPSAVLYAAFALTFVDLAAGFLLALRAPAVTPSSRLWLGLPEGAAIILYVVGLLPLIVLPLAYAFTFESTTLSDEDLSEVRRKLAELKQ